MQKILIIDRDIKFNNLLTRMLSLEGYITRRCFDISAAVDILKRESIDIILLDAVFTDKEGISSMKQIKGEYPDVYIVIMAANANLRNCVLAIKNGAEDYILKNNDISQIISLAKNIFAKKEPRIEFKSGMNHQIITNADPRLGFNNIIGDSEAITEAINLAQKVAVTEATILLLGETGTGKELFAKAIHSSGPRKAQPFIALNCSSFSKELLESELCGYKVGAFTGASQDKKGLLEEANNGTLFLDEIGELDIGIQAKLLRVLESGEFIKVGDSRINKVNIRLISATHKDLMTEVKEGTFREDLFYRLNIFNIVLPPLRERKQDVIILANYYIELFSEKLDKRITGMTNEYKSFLVNYNWKGNIRELKNIIERSIILSNDTILTEDVLPYEILSYSPAMAGGSSYALSVFERLHIHKVLTTTKWNKPEAAKLLNISVSTLYRKIEDYMLLT
jgi:two-component system NtrC family response regulator